ncbi:Plug domain-containing protein [Tannerella forsythia]|uniref:Plug domain-containing protein n=1 Tax=Tannerella forsythia TaxID=28112 RepID=UPI0028F078C6|nr:Plug domain-containing protein [Tannerella forsythia]
MTEDGKTILAYSYSQPDGSFILECPQGPQQEFLLTTSRLGYEPYRQKIPAQTQQTEILLKESSLTLREVKVISSPIRRQGDTISYYMSNFHRPQDRNLADVLARMPGIHVQSDGRVQYDGKPINRFYIEDMNLLGERYSLATKNLSPSDIAAVQVYENHEPIKMLRDRSQTEQAALNIKLKDFSSPYTLRQKIHLPRVHLKNNTSILRLLGNVSAGIENESEYTHLPQKLMLSSSDSLPLFRAGNVGQSCRFSEGFSNTHITLNYKKHDQSFGLKCGIAWTGQKIESDLSPCPLVTDTFVNDLTWHTSRFYVEPSYRINYRSWTISSSASANHLRTNYSGKKATYTYIHPRLRLMFAPSGDFKFNAGYSYTTYYGDLNEMRTGYVLERYNLFSKGIEALQFNASQSINFGVFYKNISHFLQMSYLTIYSLYKDNLIPASFVRDIYTFSWWEQKDRLSSFWINTLSASKLFMEISLTASINLSYNQSKSVVEQQGSSINYTQHSFGVEPSLKWKAKRNLNFDYMMNAFFSGISMNHRPIDSYIPLINHRLYTYFGATDRLFFTCNLQHFYIKAPYTSTSNLLFTDLGIQYDFQHLTLILDWSNIFNRKLHVISGYNTINTVTQTDKLRPSEVLISLRFKH